MMVEVGNHAKAEDK